MSTEADFFATRVEVEDMRNGCVRLYYYSDRWPPGSDVLESSLLFTVVLPAAACLRCNKTTRQIISTTKIGTEIHAPH